ncbi:MAG: PEGA domain-containing protein [Pseudomonadota bacterium]
MPTPLLLLAALHAAPLTTTAEQAVTAVTDDEHGLAVRLAEQALAELPQATAPVPTQDLATLYQVLGAVGVFTQDPALTTRGFTGACAVDPAWFNDRLGPLAKSQWSATCAADAGSASLTVAPLPAGAQLYVDGRAHERGDLTLRPGPHLVQVLSEGHEPLARALTLEDGQSATVDTGLTPPPKEHHLTAFGVGGAAAGVGALVLGGVTLAKEAKLRKGMDEGTYTYANRDDLLSDYAAYANLRTASLVLGGVGAVGIGLHFAFR